MYIHIPTWYCSTSKGDYFNEKPKRKSSLKGKFYIYFATINSNEVEKNVAQQIRDCMGVEITPMLNSLLTLRQSQALLLEGNNVSCSGDSHHRETEA